jgi:hypothetical protein
MATSQWFHRVSLGMEREEAGFNSISHGIRATMFEIQEACNATFRNTYSRAADQVMDIVQCDKLSSVVELGAGTAPIARLLAANPRAEGVSVTVCDLLPDEATYEGLAAQYPGRIKAVVEPIDFSVPREWGPGVLLVVVNTFPALASAERTRALAALTGSADRVLVFEASRRSMLSMLISVCAFVPGWLLPFTMRARQGFLRRVLWCWLVPAAPIYYVIDALWWNRRCWTDRQWQQALSHLAQTRAPRIISTGNTQAVIW